MTLLMQRVLAGESAAHHFSNDIVEQATKILEDGKGGKYKDTAKALSKVFSEGINGVIEVRIVSMPFTAAILPPDLTFRHPLINEFRNHNFAGKDGVALLQKSKMEVGDFNPATGKLSGMMSKLVGVLNISTDMIDGKMLTFEESIAICGHEVGHHLGYCAAVSSLVRGNAAVSYATKQVLKEEDRVNRIAVIKTAVGVVDAELDSRDLLAAADADNEEVTTGIISTTAARKFRSKFGSSMYDRQLYEQISDQYVSRLGLAVPLGKALVKIHKACGAYETQTSASFIVLEILKLCFLLGTIFVNPFSLFVYYFTSKAIFTSRSEYPTLSERINKLINDANSSLATDSLTDDQKTRVLKNIADLKDTQRNIKRDHGVISAIYTWVHTSREDRSISEQMRTLENLTNNKLFASAALLSTTK